MKEASSPFSSKEILTLVDLPDSAQSLSKEAAVPFEAVHAGHLYFLNGVQYLKNISPKCPARAAEMVCFRRNARDFPGSSVLKAVLPVQRVQV